MEFNEKLQELRKQKGLTQEQLAQQLYVSRTAISKWESGRGCPSIESLKAIAKFFSVPIDQLLSSEEIIATAEDYVQEKTTNMKNQVFGILDCMILLLFFLPFFGVKSGDSYRAVSLLSYTGVLRYTWNAYIVVVSVSGLYGILQLILHNLDNRFWIKNRAVISVGITFLGIGIFMISHQPYAAVFLLCLLGIKGFLLIKRG